MSTNHTPLPWDVQNKGTLGERSARHEIVAGVNVDGSKNLPTICRMPNLSERSYANAEFIVLAVNCHDELLLALQAAMQGIDTILDLAQEHDPQTGFLKPVDPYKILGAIQTRLCCFKARAAIAKAEGREA